MVKAQIDWNDLPDELGTVDLILDENNYLGSFVGRKNALAGKLAEEGFMGLAGYILKTKIKTPIGYLSGMEVSKQGKGVGSSLVFALLGSLREIGVRTVFLHRSRSPRSSDKQLFDFYSRFGFVGVGRCEEDIWPVMRLDM
jgi:ribosomal protein S18 acetylase RimI-like enzyme